MIEQDYPHKEWIRKNGTVRIPSVFMFKEGVTDLFAFLYGCEKENCVVKFVNEGITVRPRGDSDAWSRINLLLSIYAHLAHDDTIIRQYNDYLHKIAGKNEFVE